MLASAASTETAVGTGSSRVPAVPERMQIGKRADEGAPLGLAPEVLLRHVMALGSSGSGKTAFCKVVVEEAVRRGIPALCVDPQGDLASFGAGVVSAAELEAHGVDPAIARDFEARAEVVVFTPGSSRGVPLSADPVDSALLSFSGEERTAAVSRTAAMAVGLLGFELDADDGAGLIAVIDRALTELLDAGIEPSLALLTEQLFAAEKDDFAAYSRLLDARKIRLACQRLARLDVGARRSLFHGGVPIDIDVLLGRDPRAPVAEGKTRIAVVYLNTLHAQEDKDFFVAALADRLYAWMLAHPSAEPQALFYIDEVAPFLPPVRKPACKEGLSLLFKQARKYGVGCLMATQNPGDVDYRAMAQFGTWALGRLTTRQDLKKIEPNVKSLAPEQSDSILERLPALKPGQMILLSPDQLDAPVEVHTRWLVTKHETWTEERIEEHTDAIRERFVALNAELREPSARPEPVATPTSLHPELSVLPEPALLSEDEERSPQKEPLRSTSRDREVLDALARLPSASVSELAAMVQAGEATVRRALHRLVEAGEVRSFTEGRGRRYWALSTGGRPDLAMPATVLTLAPKLSVEDAERIGAAHLRSSLLGVIGDDETFERVERSHRLVHRVAFEEKVDRSALARLFGRAPDERLGHLYLHPHSLAVLVFSNERGIVFDAERRGRASDLCDLEGVAAIEEVPPGALDIDERDWSARKSEEEARQFIRERFAATPGEVTPLFVPLYRLFFRSTKGNLRRMTIDGLVGRRVDWPEPPNE